MRLVLAVARAGSILRAASEVGLSQPALSKCIAELEDTLGVKLFDRTNRGITPTPHGEVMLRRATGVFEELRQAVDEIGFLANGTHGDLRVGGTPTMCAGIIPHTISSVMSARAHLRFQVTELELEKLVGEVAARSLDFGVGRMEHSGDESVVFDHLFDDRLFVVASARHPLASRKSVALEDALQYQWVLPTRDSSMTTQLRAEFKRRRLELPKPAVGTMSVLIRYRLIQTIPFVTVMYGSVLRFGNVPTFVRVLPIEMQSSVPVGVVRLKGRTLAPSAELFIQSAKELVRSLHSLNAKHLRREFKA